MARLVRSCRSGSIDLPVEAEDSTLVFSTSKYKAKEREVNDVSQPRPGSARLPCLLARRSPTPSGLWLSASLIFRDKTILTNSPTSTHPPTDVASPLGSLIHTRFSLCLSASAPPLVRRRASCCPFAPNPPRVVSLKGLG